MHAFRKYLAILYLVMISLSSTAFCKSIVTTPNQVIVGRNGIYVKTTDGLKPVHSIVEAQNGSLIAVAKSDDEYEDIEWNCPRCGATNSGTGVCSVCDWPLYDDEDIQFSHY